jgi:membrane-associated phospholipid phosphatase
VPHPFRAALAAFSFAVTAAADPAEKEVAEQPAPRRHFDLKNTSWPFLAAETGGAVVVFIGFALATDDPPEACRWCATNDFDDGIRGALRASNPRPFAYVSHGFSLGVVPAIAILGNVLPAVADHRIDRLKADLWILANTFILTTGITDGIKRAAGRERPAFHYGVQGETEAANLPIERNLSFFSGDTSWAFSLAACGTTLAYLHGYESAPWVLAGGATFATAAGVFRIVADMHWTTDVIAGSLVGTAIGVSVPLALHRREKPAKAVASWNLVALPQSVTVWGVF